MLLSAVYGDGTMDVLGELESRVLELVCRRVRGANYKKERQAAREGRRCVVVGVVVVSLGCLWGCLVGCFFLCFPLSAARRGERRFAARGDVQPVRCIQSLRMFVLLICVMCLTK